MHTDLSPHLHTPECNKLINDLKACHEKNKFARFLGYCNEFDSLVVKCLRQERASNAAANRVKAVERQKTLRDKIQQS